MSMLARQTSDPIKTTALLRRRAASAAVSLSLLASALAVFAGAGRAAQVVLILRPGGGDSWQIQEAEKIAVNNKDKVRLGFSKQLDLAANDYNRLVANQILQVGLMRKHAGGYMVRKVSGEWQPVAPDGASLKASTSYAALWSSAAIVIQKDKSAKSAVTLKAADVFAVIPGSDRNEAVASLLVDEANFRGVGEKDEDEVFAERTSLLIGVASSVTGPASAKLQAITLSVMEGAEQRLSTGIAHYSDLSLGLKWAPISEKAYPDDDRQKRARAALTARKAWLDQRVAILKALNAGELWDAFIEKYPEFERWDNSFDDVLKMREKAFQMSFTQHREEGTRLKDAKQYAAALQELKLAQSRKPSDATVADLIDTAQTEEARAYAGSVKQAPVDLTSPTQSRITRDLQYARSYIKDGRLDDAEAQIKDAEGQDPKSTRIVLARAELLQARKQLLQAADLLKSNYLRRVTTEDEIAKGEELLNTITYQTKTTKESLKVSAAKAQSQGDYPAALATAKSGLDLDPDDPDFLLQAGISSAVLRKKAEAEQLLNKYLARTQTPDADQKKRLAVQQFIPLLKHTLPEPQGKENWYSGYKSPPGAPYCPLSLAFNEKVATIHGSQGLNVVYTWTNDQLTSVNTTIATASQPQGKGFIAYFDYFKDAKAVRRVNSQPFDPKEDPGSPRFTAEGAVGPGKGAYVGLPNHPTVDPWMVQTLVGTTVATIVTGNPYFHPFVWNGIYVFVAEYDEQGRVQSAREIASTDQKEKPRTFDFRWQGWRLMEIAEREPDKEPHLGGGYRRTMTYTNNKLTAETVSFQGKTSKIEYKYAGDQLTEANCDDDPSIDGRSRHVKFR